ncbi:MAG: glycosyltransferase family 2 protein [Candidatus Helarchaeota archaeon]
MNNIENSQHQQKTNPKVGIVILNWNNYKDTLQCLESVYSMDYLNIEVLVIDNGSDKNPEEILKEEYPKINYMRNERNLGYTGGNNQGLKHFSIKDVDFIWLLNNDAIVDQNCLNNLIKAVCLQNKIGLASPIIFNNEGDETLLYCGTSINLEEGTKKRAKNLKEYSQWQKSESDLICLWGTALLINQLLIKEIGFLDETFFAYSEDMDYSIRSIKAGYKNIVVKSAKIYHELRSIKYDTFPYHYHYYMARNQYYFLKKYNNLKKSYFFNILIKASTFMIHNDENASEATLDGIWSAIKGYTGEWQNRIKCPSFLKNAIKKHPYFWRYVAKHII